MNALSRVTRALSVGLCALLLSASFPQEALAHVVASVPRVGTPVAPASGVRAPGLGAGLETSPSLSLTASLLPAASLSLPAPQLGVPAALGETPAPAPRPARQPVERPRGTGPAADRPGMLEPAAAPRAAPTLAPAPLAPASASLAAAADAPEASEFKAAPGASSVADASAIARGFAALRRAWSSRRAETFAAAADAPAPVRAASGAASRAAALAPAARLSAANDGQDAPPVPPDAPRQPAPAGDEGKGGALGLGLPALSFIGALLVAQVGVEAMGNAMPVLVQQVFGSFAVVAQIAIFSSIAGIIGRQLAPMIIQKYGLRKVYLATELARMLSITAMLALLATGHMSLTGMMAFYSINGLVGGVALTAETSIPPALVGQDELKLQRFWTWEQTLLEIIGIIGPIAAGSAVDSYGAATVLIAYPVAFLAAIAILFLTLRIPAKLELMRKADLEKAKNAGHDPEKERANAGALAAGQAAVAALLGVGTLLALLNGAWLGAGLLAAGTLSLGLLAARLRARVRDPRLTLNKAENVFGAFFARVARGAKLVWGNPLLRYAFLGYSVYMMLNPFLYSILAPAYGLLIGGKAGMGGIFGTVAGLYSLGGLLGGLYMAREQSKADKAQREGSMTPEQVNESLRKSMIRMMMWTIPTLAAFATVFLPNPAFLASLAIPYPFISGYFIAPGTVTLFALALIPFGFAQVISTVKLRSYFQAKVGDPSDMADAMGFFGSASLIISTIGLQSLSWLFQHTSGLTPFMVFGGVLVPLAVAYFLLTRRLDRSAK